MVIPSIRLPSSALSALRLLLYPRFLLIMSSTRASSSKLMGWEAARALNRSVSKVVPGPFSERILSSWIKEALRRISSKFFLRSL